MIYRSDYTVRFDLQKFDTLRHDLLKLFIEEVEYEEEEEEGEGKKLVYRRQVDNGTRYGMLFAAKWYPRLFDVQTSSLDRNDPPRSLCFSIYGSRVWIETRSQWRAYTVISRHDLIIARSPSSPPSCFLIATNLCEIVNVALILRFVILISNIFYANLYLFHRSKENWICIKYY